MIPYIYTSFSLLFVVSFLWGIKLMNSPGTAIKGNILSAFSMFGVGNLRATVSDIKEHAHSMGLHVFRTTGRHGETRYGLTKKRSRR